MHYSSWAAIFGEFKYRSRCHQLLVEEALWKYKYKARGPCISPPCPQTSCTAGATVAFASLSSCCHWVCNWVSVLWIFFFLVYTAHTEGQGHFLLFYQLHWQDHSKLKCGSSEKKSHKYTPSIISSYTN